MIYYTEQECARQMGINCCIAHIGMWSVLLESKALLEWNCSCTSNDLSVYFPVESVQYSMFCLLSSECCLF